MIEPLCNLAMRLLEWWLTHLQLLAIAAAGPAIAEAVASVIATFLALIVGAITFVIAVGVALWALWRLPRRAVAPQEAVL